MSDSKVVVSFRIEPHYKDLVEQHHLDKREIFLKGLQQTLKENTALSGHHLQDLLTKKKSLENYYQSQLEIIESEITEVQKGQLSVEQKVQELLEDYFQFIQHKFINNKAKVEWALDPEKYVSFMVEIAPNDIVPYFKKLHLEISYYQLLELIRRGYDHTTS